MLAPAFLANSKLETMTKKEEWEIGYSRENPAEKPQSVNFEKSETLVGQMLDGRFLIDKDLTEAGADAGGIGLVYLAQDLKLMGKQTVVKILRQDSLKNQDIARKFLHEKEALIRLDHPNIVRILDSGELSDGNPFMVMDFIEGFSLRRKLRDGGKLAFDEAAHIIEAVTDGLSAAHAQKILHRDIKPENIMLTPQDESFERVRLIDFGIARVEESKLAPATEIQRGIGTILYIAPEQLAGKREQTPAVDVYSFAIVAFEMLTGELPFKPQSIVEMYELQKQGVKVLPRDLRKDLPAKAQEILLSALAFDPSERPQNARKFGRELAAALRETSDEAAEHEKTTKDFAIAPTEDFSGHGLAKTAASDFKSVETVQPIAPTRISFGEETNQSEINLPPTERKKSKKTLFAALFVALILAAAIPIGLLIWKNAEKSDANKAVSNDSSNNSKNTATADKPTNEAATEISYHLLVQKMRGGKLFEEPFKSSGQEIFENGYKFKLIFQSDADGFFYIFSESKDADGKTFYNILYPTPKTNNGSAEVRARQTIETGQNTFGGESTTEIVWLIWTKDKTDDLESARTSAFAAQGAVKDEKNVRLLSDFVQEYGQEKPETSKDTANRQTIVKGKSDVIVQKIELEHR